MYSVVKKSIWNKQIHQTNSLFFVFPAHVTRLHRSYKLEDDDFEDEDDEEENIIEGKKYFDNN